MFINAGNEEPWKVPSSELEYRKNLNYTSDFMIRIRQYILENLKTVRTQKKGGRSNGVSFVLNPELDEHFCSLQEGVGFLVRHFLYKSFKILQ